MSTLIDLNLPIAVFQKNEDPFKRLRSAVITVTLDTLSNYDEASNSPRVMTTEMFIMFIFTVVGFLFTVRYQFALIHDVVHHLLLSAIGSDLSCCSTVVSETQSFNVKSKSTYKITSEWLCRARANKIPLSGPLIQEKAPEIAKKRGYLNFKASSG